MNIKINVFGSTFKHANTVGNDSLKLYPTYFNWVYNNKDVLINFYVDDNLFNNKLDKNKINIAWLIEPKSYLPNNYNLDKLLEKNYNYILTHNKSLIEEGKNKYNYNNIIFFSFGGCWIYPNDHKIYEKNKNISIIASEKNFLYGHKLRHIIINKYKNKFDLICGRGYNYINYKLDALKDFRYSVVIENCSEDYYFSEKIIDCFITGTIPIYYGCPSINKFFDINGILQFNNLEEFDYIINNINLIEFYNNALYNNKSIINNFYKALEYIILEDKLYKDFLIKYNLI